MRALKCDRCGLFFNYKDKTDVDYSNIVVNDCGWNHCLDLCPRCQKELIRFLKDDEPIYVPEVVYGSFNSYEEAGDALKHLKGILMSSRDGVLLLADLLNYLKVPVRVGIENCNSLCHFGWSGSLLDRARIVEYSIVNHPDAYVLALPDPERFFDKLVPESESEADNSQEKQGL